MSGWSRKSPRIRCEGKNCWKVGTARSGGTGCRMICELNWTNSSPATSTGTTEKQSQHLMAPVAGLTWKLDSVDITNIGRTSVVILKPAVRSATNGDAITAIKFGWMAEIGYQQGRREWKLGYELLVRSDGNSKSCNAIQNASLPFITVSTSQFADQQHRTDQHAGNVTQPGTVGWERPQFCSIQTQHEKRVVKEQNGQETDAERGGIVGSLQPHCHRNPNHNECQATKPLSPSSMGNDMQSI